MLRAGDRRVYVFTIPSQAEWLAAQSGSLDFRLPRALDELAASWDNVFFLDLLPAFRDVASRQSREYRDYTLGCDWHWSAEGHAVAADAVHSFAFD